MACITPYRGDSSQLLLYKIASCLAGGDESGPVQSFNGRGGIVTLLSADVTGALGFTPLSQAAASALYVLKAGDSMTGLLSIDTAVTSLRAIVTDAGTNNVPFAFELYHRSSGTPIAGFGSRIQFYGNSSTTADQFQSRIESNWVDPTHATRSSQIAFGTRTSGGVISTPLILRAQALGLSGAVGAPFYSFQNELTSGMYLNGAGNLAFAVAGALVGNLTAGGLAITGGSLAASSPAVSAAQTWNNAGAVFTGLLLNITDTASTAGSFIFDFQKNGTGVFNLDNVPNLRFIRQDQSNSAAAFFLRKRGDSTSSANAIASGAGLGTLFFSGWNSAANVQPASIRAIADEVFTGSVNGTRLDLFYTAIGSNTSVVGLSIAGTGISHSLSVAFPYVAKTAGYTVTALDFLINCTANSFTLDLPTAVGISGRVYVVKNSGAGSITVDPSGAQTIDGAATATVATTASIRIMSNGANWISF